MPKMRSLSFLLAVGFGFCLVGSSPAFAGPPFFVDIFD